MVISYTLSFYIVMMQALSFVESVMDKGVSIVDKAYSQPDLRFGSECVQVVRDAAMLGLLIGHVGLTIRVSAVRTCRAPEHSAMSCTSSECTLPGCKGNRLRLMTVEEEAEHDMNDDSSNPRPAAARHAPSPPLYMMELPHHKNTGRGVSMPPIPITSHKLRLLIRCWAEDGRFRASMLAKKKEVCVSPYISPFVYVFRYVLSE